MTFCLSFSPEFFSGDDPYPMASDRPTSILQAIVSLPGVTQVELARDCLDWDDELLAKVEPWETETFAFEVLDLARSVDTCTDLTTPVEVWLDPEGFYRVDVY